MDIELKRIAFRGKFLNIFRNERMALGFTEIGMGQGDLIEYFPGTRWIELKQIHSNRIFGSNRVMPDTKGDGIILENRNTMAIIKTADCVPLFFWNTDFSFGGIVHIGWRGLQKKIEQVLLKKLEKCKQSPKSFRFFLGPAIEPECYPVGRDVFDKFHLYFYREQAFSPINKEKYFLDIKTAVRLSLIQSGITSVNIIDSKICTFCNQNRFPSYRRDRHTKNRIFNFLVFPQGNPLNQCRFPHHVT